MNLAAAIEALYPEAVNLRDFRVAHEKGESRIAEWNEEKLGPTPTLEELERGWLLVVQKLKKREFTARMHEEIQKLYPEGNWVAEATLEPPGQRLAEARRLKERRDRGHGAVELEAKKPGASAEDVEALSWDGA